MVETGWILIPHYLLLLVLELILVEYTGLQEEVVDVLTLDTLAVQVAKAEVVQVHLLELLLLAQLIQAAVAEVLIEAHTLVG